MKTKECNNCYKSNDAKAAFCGSCGQPMAAVQTMVSPTHAVMMQPKANSSRQVMFLGIALIAGVAVWEAAQVLPGKVDNYLASRYASHQEDSVYITEPVVNVYDDRGLYNAMRDIESAINRDTPKMVNQVLKLSNVNYRPSQKTMTYNYEVRGASFHSVPVSTIESGLYRRYCKGTDFAELRANKVSAKFIYWDDGRRLLERNLSDCGQ